MSKTTIAEKVVYAGYDTAVLFCSDIVGVCRVLAEKRRVL